MSEELSNPKVVFNAANEFEAGAVVTALIERGIFAKAVGGFTASFAVEAPGDVAVVVRAAEFEAAQKALSEIRPLEDNIDWSQVDVGKPED